MVMLCLLFLHSSGETAIAVNSRWIFVFVLSFVLLLMSRCPCGFYVLFFRWPLLTASVETFKMSQWIDGEQTDLCLWIYNGFDDGFGGGNFGENLICDGVFTVGGFDGGFDGEHYGETTVTT